MICYSSPTSLSILEGKQLVRASTDSKKLFYFRYMKRAYWGFPFPSEITKKISLWDTIKEKWSIVSSSFLNKLSLDNLETFNDSRSTKATSFHY